MSMPTVFVSHGSPMLYLEKDVPARAFLATLGGDVQTLRNAETRGVVAAWNQAARAASGRHLVFLAPDALPGQGWLRGLVGRVEADPATAVFADDGALLVRRERFEAVGGFGETAPTALAAQDLGRRLRARGWGVVGEQHVDAGAAS